MNTIGKRLREERTRLGLSQEKLALAGGVQKRTQINYEANERSPDSNYLALIAQIGVDVNYILTGVRITQYKTDDGELGDNVVNINAYEIGKIIATLDEKQQQEIFAVIAGKKREHELEATTRRLENTIEQMQHQIERLKVA